jgi:hypothetical protein
LLAFDKLLRIIQGQLFNLRFECKLLGEVSMARACPFCVLVLIGALPSTGFCQGFLGGLQFLMRFEQPGKVLVDGVWTSPENVARTAQGNDTIRMYCLLRSETPDTLIGQTGLARWCHENDLLPQRDAHLKRALVHDSENEQIRQLLGHQRINGAWIAPDQIAIERERLEAATQRMQEWREPVTEILWMLKSSSDEERQSGLKKLMEIDDPNAVTALEVILVYNRPSIAIQTLDTIAGFDEREATESLLRIAFSSPNREVRARATELLADRNPYDFVPALLNQLVTPISTRFSITPDRRGNVMYQFALFQQNMETDAILQFDRSMRQVPFAANSMTQRNMMANARQRARAASSGIQRLNRSIRSNNQSIQDLLARTTGEEPGDAPEDWWRWWYDENEVYTSVRPLSYRRVDETELVAVPTLEGGGAKGECLIAGTPIWTDRGPVPVDELEVGDRVLCQDLDTSRLEYQVVLQPTERPATPTFRISIGGESIQASGGHYFWVEGRGWTRTRELTTAMSIDTANGSPIAIDAIESAETVPLYNVVVDRHSNYFVGQHRILSHDSSIPNRGAPTIKQSLAARQKQAVERFRN